jgi:hypothetical protein
MLKSECYMFNSSSLSGAINKSKNNDQFTGSFHSKGWKISAKLATLRKGPSRRGKNILNVGKCSGTANPSRPIVSLFFPQLFT